MAIVQNTTRATKAVGVMRSYQGLFVGLVTLDVIYRAIAPPQANQKQVATDYQVLAGGPATNAAITFQHLGNSATVLGAVGCHAIAALIRADLQPLATLVDLVPDRAAPPPISSIVVTEATGERAVISFNATNAQICPDQIPAGILQDVAIVLVDGHQMAVGRAIAAQAKAAGIPVVVDGGSWKPGFETVLALTDYAICSANFFPPGCHSDDDVQEYLEALGVPHVAITHGEHPIAYRSTTPTGTIVGEIAVSKVRAIDTLGAGDVFHGAFCHAILQMGFPEALTKASQQAARSCQFFGPRRWMTDPTG